MKKIISLRLIRVMAVATLVAVLCTSRWMLIQAAGSPQIAVAATDIDVGQCLRPSFIKLIDWPAGSIPAGAFNDPQRLAGRVPTTSMRRGELLLEAKLAPVDPVVSLSAAIGAGRRPIKVRVSGATGKPGLEGLALAGNYVDVFATRREGGGPQSDARDRKFSTILLKKIHVLAVAREVNHDATSPRLVDVVTLDIAPDEAEQIALARSVGAVWLKLRDQVKVADEAIGSVATLLLPGQSTALLAHAPTAGIVPLVQRGAAMQRVGD